MNLNPHILLLSICLSFSIKSFSQLNFPFPQDSVQWCTYYYGYTSYEGFYDINLFSFDLGTDTIIDGLNYKNVDIWQRWRDNESPWYDFPSDVEDVLLGKIAALRFDGDKVFLYRYLNSEFDFSGFMCPYETEVLLYDFNLQVGDSIYYEYLYPNYVTTTSIDSILLEDGNYHKTYTFDDPSVRVWIEGVGDSQFGLLGFYIHQMIEGGFGGVSFLKNETVLYQSGLSDCDLGGINSIQEVFQSQDIYFDQNSTLIINIPNRTADYVLSVFDMNGLKIFSSCLLNENKFDLHFVNPGIYLAVVQNKGRNICNQKFAVTD